MNPEDYEASESELEALFKQSSSIPAPNPSASDARIKSIMDRVKVQASLKAGADFALKGTGETATELCRGLIDAFLAASTQPEEETPDAPKQIAEEPSSEGILDFPFENEAGSQPT